MIPKESYKEARRIEATGGYGWYGLQINIAMENDECIESERVRNALYHAEKLVSNAVQLEQVLSDKDKVNQAKADQQKLVEQFPEPIYVKEIPNGYWGDDHPAGVLNPWLLVTTRIGVFKVGFRKRVIELSWEDTDAKSVDGDEIFKDEGVTVEQSMVHAWSFEKLGEYIARIFEEYDKSNVSQV
jgi:hypothetical protein